MALTVNFTVQGIGAMVKALEEIGREKKKAEDALRQVANQRGRTRRTRRVRRGRR
jgi:hypothetical protein